MLLLDQGFALAPGRCVRCPSQHALLCTARSRTYDWIKSQLDAEKQKGVDASKYSHSTIVQTSAPVELGSLRKADGEEGFE